MCSTVAKAIGAQAASRIATPFGDGNDAPRRQVDEVAGEAVDMEAHDAGDVLAQVIAALAAGFAGAAGQSAIHHHAVAELERSVRPDRGDFARGLGAHHQRQLAPGEGHAAKAPEIEVIERHRLDAHLHLAGRGRRRRRHVGKLELAVGDQGEGAHGLSPAGRRGTDGRGHPGSRAITSETFCPPKPNELEMARRTRASRATFGTTSNGIAGSGTL